MGNRLVAQEGNPLLEADHRISVIGSLAVFAKVVAGLEIDAHDFARTRRKLVSVPLELVVVMAGVRLVFDEERCRSPRDLGLEEDVDVLELLHWPRAKPNCFRRDALTSGSPPQQGDERAP